MKLGLIYRGIVEEKGDGYYIKDVTGDYLEKIASSFSQIDLCAPVYPEIPGERSFSHYKLHFRNINLCNLGLPNSEYSILSKLSYYFKLIKLFYAHVQTWDVLYIFLPGYRGVIASVFARILNKPYFVYTGIDWKDSSIYAWRWPGMKKWMLFPIYAFLNRYLEKMVIKYSTFTLVHGNALQDKYRHLGKKIVQTSPLITLSNEDLFVRTGLINGGPVKCLFVGGLIPRKGIAYLIRALPVLKKKGYEVTLNLIGADGNNYENTLRELVKNLNLDGDITFTGYIPNGPELFEIYRNSDIFVLPTLSEGFPRVLYEALSQSLPIVTTNVGGIPGIMNDEVNALLVPPKNPAALAGAIERLITNKRLRKQLTRNGIKTVREILKGDTAKQLESLLVTFIPSYREWAKKERNH